MNVLTIRRELVKRGVPKEHVGWICICDNQIILMIADEMCCTARNKYYGRIDSVEHDCDLYRWDYCDDCRLEDSNIGFYGNDVTVDSFLGVLTSAVLYHM